MTYGEFIQKIARDSSVDQATVRKIMDTAVLTLTTTMGKVGDEIKIKDLGTFYPNTYNVRSGPLEFSATAQSSGGQRRQIRFRPLESSNALITHLWEESKKK